MRQSELGTDLQRVQRDEARFEALVSRARGAADPVAEMERIARTLWWSMPVGGFDRGHALDALSGRGD